MMWRVRAGSRSAFLGVLWAGTAAALLVAAFVGYCAFTLPFAGGIATEPTPAAIVFTADNGRVFAARGVSKGNRVAIDQLPADLIHAVIAIEDRRFFAHHGIDIRGMLRAAWHNMRDDGAVQGASTITQQLVRMSYLSPERSLRRKLQEVMIALWLEARLDKDEILARYLNTAYFGAGAYGIDAAAQRYFGKKAASLDLSESAMLAGLVRAPSQLAPNRNTEAAQRRADAVLGAMVAAGYLDEARAAAARAHPAKLAVPPETPPGQNYFVDAAESELKRLIGSPPMDLGVDTTLDPRLQDAAERVVAKWLGREGARRHVGQAALVALAPDGAVLALVGGTDYAQSQFNRAVQARRQPGSLFKIFVYLAAFNAGYTPDSIIVDQPVRIGDWEPKNFEGGYQGPVALRTAFAQSINTVSVQLTQSVGVQRVIDTARSFGVHTELPAVPSLALGSAEVTLLDMTGAMDAIAVNAKAIEPYTIRKVRAGARAPLYTRPETAIETPGWNRAALVPLLEAVVNNGTGRAARLGRRAAGKTGTTQDYRDAWFVGFTTDIVVGVWVGNDDNSPMERVVGGDLPAKIWHDYVEEAERILSRPVAEITRAPAGSGGDATGAIPGQPVGSAGTAGPAAENASASAASAEAPAILRGVPAVTDTATLVFRGRTAHLTGVEGEKGEFARELVRYIGGREVVCEPSEPATTQYRCKVGNIDLGEAVILNGAGRAAANASERLLSAEEKAQVAGRGVWRE
jgi:penicillin-binding protein 1A